MGENLHDLGCGNDCLDTTPKTHPWKEELISWTSLKLKTAPQKQCQENDKISHRLGENICKRHISKKKKKDTPHKKLLSKKDKPPLKFSNKNITKLIKTGQRH